MPQRRHVLRQARERKGLTIADMASELGVSESFLYKIEEGVRNPGLELAKRIAARLDTTMDALFFARQLDETSQAEASSEVAS